MSYPALSQDQLSALESIYACRKSLRSLSGPAGTGKTTVIREMAQKWPDAAVAAYTNVAAGVLRKKGLAATTIHRKFYVPEEVENPVTGRKRTVFVPAWRWLERGEKLPPDKTDYVHTVILDEASMLPTWMVRDIQRMSERLILVGDGHQLPPVADKQSPRGFFNTLTHTAELTTVHRQAEGCPALSVATLLRTGELDPLSRTVVAPFSPTMGLREHIKQLDAADKSWRAITFTNRVRHTMNGLIRGYYGHAEKVAPQPGERLISLDTYSDRIVNGTFLRVVSSGRFPQTFEELGGCLYPSLLVEIEGEEDLGPCCIHISALRYLSGFKSDAAVAARNSLLTLSKAGVESTPTTGVAEIDFGYAITCHKAQGSEFDHVFMIDERYIYYVVAQKEADQGDASDPLSGVEAARRWAYTAMTRTRAGLVVIPSKLIK